MEQFTLRNVPLEQARVRTAVRYKQLSRGGREGPHIHVAARDIEDFLHPNARWGIRLFRSTSDSLLAIGHQGSRHCNREDTHRCSSIVEKSLERLAFHQLDAAPSKALSVVPPLFYASTAACTAQGTPEGI